MMMRNILIHTQSSVKLVEIHQHTQRQAEQRKASVYPKCKLRSGSNWTCFT